MAIRKKSFKKAVFSVFSWNVSAAGLLRGVFNTPGDPIARVQTRVLQEPRLSERT
jgi:hypothetical protein